MYICIFLIFMSFSCVEVKVFIGECSYGFCEQGCHRVETDTMQCFCYKGYVMKSDGRKCEKAPDDNTYSGDHISGDTVNCDDETGECDINAISGEGIEEEFSGDEWHTTSKIKTFNSKTHIRKYIVVASTTTSKHFLSSTLTSAKSKLPEVEGKIVESTSKRADRTSMTRSSYVTQSPLNLRSSHKPAEVMVTTELASRQTEIVLPNSIVYYPPHLPFVSNSTNSSVLLQKVNHSALSTKSSHFSHKINHSALSTKSTGFSKTINNSAFNPSNIEVSKQISNSLISRFTLAVPVSIHSSSSHISTYQSSTVQSSPEISSVPSVIFASNSIPKQLRSSKIATTKSSMIESPKLLFGINTERPATSTFKTASNMRVTPNINITSSVITIDRAYFKSVSLTDFSIGVTSKFFTQSSNDTSEKQTLMKKSLFPSKQFRKISTRNSITSPKSMNTKMSSFFAVKSDSNTGLRSSITTSVPLSIAFMSKSSWNKRKSLLKSSFDIALNSFMKSTSRTQSLIEIPSSTSSYPTISVVDTTATYIRETYTNFHMSQKAVSWSDSSSTSYKNKFIPSTFNTVNHFIGKSRFSTITRAFVSNTERKSTNNSPLKSKQYIFTPILDSTVKATTSDVLATVAPGNQTSRKGDGSIINISPLLVLGLLVFACAQLVQ